jgi:zinc transporter, ZIP family
MSEAIEMTPYRVGVAFAVVIAAGLCTTVGAFAVFCAGVANKKVLAGALGASAGTY